MGSKPRPIIVSGKQSISEAAGKSSSARNPSWVAVAKGEKSSGDLKGNQTKLASTASSWAHEASARADTALGHQNAAQAHKEAADQNTKAGNADKAEEHRQKSIEHISSSLDRKSTDGDVPRDDHGRFASK